MNEHIATNLIKRAARAVQTLIDKGHGKAAHALGDKTGEFRKARIGDAAYLANILAAEEIIGSIPAREPVAAPVVRPADMPGERTTWPAIEGGGH